ncbi:MAG: PorV/PorQ family protein [Bacteroidota bacterium]
MKKFYLILLCSFLTPALLVAQQDAPENVAQSGGSQLSINSFARSSGVMGLDVSSTTGIEASAVNPAGVAAGQGTELVFAHTLWMIGSEIRVNTFGFSQNLGSGGGALGLTVNAFSLGDFTRTTVDQTKGELGTFSPTMLNIGVSYAKKFTDNIYVGTTVRVISEATPEANAAGVAFDAGIQYRTGVEDRLKLGVSLRNVGPTMKYGGDGLGQRVSLNGNDFLSGSSVPAAEYELPVALNLGVSYDIRLDKSNVISLMGSYISNSTYYNQGGAGIEYRYKKYVSFRGAFLYENGIFTDLNTIGGDRYTAFTGGAVGASFRVPLRKDQDEDKFSAFSLDTSYRFTNPFSGTLTVGASMTL